MAGWYREWELQHMFQQSQYLLKLIFQLLLKKKRLILLTATPAAAAVKRHRSMIKCTRKQSKRL